MQLEELKKNWTVSEYNEDTEDQMEYYINENACHVGDKAYLYRHDEGELIEMEIIRVISRTDDMYIYDLLSEHEDILVFGEEEYGADTSAEFITDNNCYMIWFKYCDSDSVELAYLGDDCQIELPDEVIDCSRLGFFDEMEEECWNLVKKYCDFLGIKMVPDDDGDIPISFDIAKGIQDFILENMEDAGVKFKFDEDCQLSRESIKRIMIDCLETRGCDASDEELEALLDIYEDCQEWDDDEMLTGRTYDEVEDFIKHSSAVDEVLDCD